MIGYTVEWGEQVNLTHNQGLCDGMSRVLAIITQTSNATIVGYVGIRNSGNNNMPHLTLTNVNSIVLSHNSRRWVNY